MMKHTWSDKIVWISTSIIVAKGGITVAKSTCKEEVRKDVCSTFQAHKSRSRARKGPNIRQLLDIVGCTSGLHEWGHTRAMPEK